MGEGKNILTIRVDFATGIGPTKVYGKGVYSILTCRL